MNARWNHCKTTLVKQGLTAAEQSRGSSRRRSSGSRQPLPRESVSEADGHNDAVMVPMGPRPPPCGFCDPHATEGAHGFSFQERMCNAVWNWSGGWLWAKLSLRCPQLLLRFPGYVGSSNRPGSRSSATIFIGLTMTFVWSATKHSEMSPEKSKRSKQRYYIRIATSPCP